MQQLRDVKNALSQFGGFHLTDDHSDSTAPAGKDTTKPAVAGRPDDVAHASDGHITTVPKDGKAVESPHPSETHAGSPTDTRPAAANDHSSVAPKADAAQPLHKSPGIVEKADGSAEATVKPNDSLWGIARQALEHNKPEGYKPSNTDVQAAESQIAHENELNDKSVIQPGDKIQIPKDLCC